MLTTLVEFMIEQGASEQSIQRALPGLVIIDPLMAVLGHSIDSSRDQDIRAVFTPLAQLAERTNCSIRDIIGKPKIMLQNCFVGTLKSYLFQDSAVEKYVEKIKTC